MRQEKLHLEELSTKISKRIFGGQKKHIAILFLSAYQDWLKALTLIPIDEVLEFEQIITGLKFSDAFTKMFTHEPITGTQDRFDIKILNHIIPDFIQGRLQSIKIDNKTTGPARKARLLPSAKLTHWQLKRALCYHIAFINLTAAGEKIISGDFNKALPYIGDALKLIGAASVRSIDEIESLALQDGKQYAPKKGAEAKKAKLAPVRKRALELAKEGVYPSRRQAVLAIKGAILEYAKSIEGISMSADQAEKTIDGWLKEGGYTPSASKRGMSAS